MCLLAALSRVHPGAPLVVAANRDEYLERPALPLGVLRSHHPRVLGGRDEQAGGTWLTVNEHGVVAGLTNTPMPGGPDPSRRSRGELPLLLAGHRDAHDAARALAGSVRAEDYNPCWLLVGDRRGLYHLDLTGVGPPTVEALRPGIHVLENRPLGGGSSKAALVRARLEPLADHPLAALPAALAEVLASHDAPEERTPADGAPRPREVESACVHLPGYGTRSATLVLVGPGPAPPRVLAVDGPPCRHRFDDRSHLWDHGDAGGGEDGA